MSNQPKKAPCSIALLAHVDAGKTTLSEALLYCAGARRTLGRVDHQDAYLDTHALERARGITIFSKQARFSTLHREITLVDTPGHVDFAPEAERTMPVLDCAVLVIVDAVSRKYFTSETSWLWDIDFGQLNRPHVKQVLLSGRYCNDLAERFSFTDVKNWTVVPDIGEAAAQLAAQGGEDLYVVTCFSDRDKLLDLPAVKKEA